MKERTIGCPGWCFLINLHFPIDLNKYLHAKPLFSELLNKKYLGLDAGVPIIYVEEREGAFLDLYANGVKAPKLLLPVITEIITLHSSVKPKKTISK